MFEGGSVIGLYVVVWMVGGCVIFVYDVGFVLCMVEGRGFVGYVYGCVIFS